MLHSVRKKFLTIVSPLSFLRVASISTGPSVHLAYGDDFKIPTYPGDTSGTDAEQAPEPTERDRVHTLTDDRRPRQASTGGSGMVSLIWYALVAIGIALIVRFFVAAPYLVEGASMDPAFESYHYLVIDRVTYRISDPERGDVIVFRLPQEETRSLIKRIIGLPGETVVLAGTTVTIINDEYPDGLTLDEPYVAVEHESTTNMTVTLSADEYFVMGDNRAESADSRYWGALPRENIVGRAFLRVFPLDELGLFPGEARYASEITE